jgi:hypothetical protein
LALAPAAPARAEGPGATAGEEKAKQAELKVSFSPGDASAPAAARRLRLSGQQIEILDADGRGPAADGRWDPRAVVVLRYAQRPAPQPQIDKLHPIWIDLLKLSDADTARRLRDDLVYQQDPRRLTVQVDQRGPRAAAGGLGFTVTVEQLLRNQAFWIPSLDLYLAVGRRPLPLAEHRKELAAFQGRRVLDQVHAEPEASYEQYKARWEDMGSPAYQRASQPAPGHVVCLSWDSSLWKFGVDRYAGVWNDYGSSDRFRYAFDFADARSYRRQRLADGLPLVTSVFEKDAVRYEVEQWAYPLAGPPATRRGDVPMTLIQTLRLTNLGSGPKAVTLTMTHRRVLARGVGVGIESQPQGDAYLCKESGGQGVLFCLQGKGLALQAVRVSHESVDAKSPAAGGWFTIAVPVRVVLPAAGIAELVVKLPSPLAAEKDAPRLLALDAAAARAETIKFWSDYLARGMKVEVPEAAVNELFRANLWHALRLPRRHGGAGTSAAPVQIDLPYSNFAYDQQGTPWPVNQAVYVDYMLYDLRGYHHVAEEELLAIFRNSQEPNGHLKGCANWGVYTPGMLYAVAQHYRLSGDRQSLDRLLPPTLKALDWCLAEMDKAARQPGPAAGLIRTPLNDGTGEGIWAFSQAYFYAGVEGMGQVLSEIGDPRGAVCLDAARRFHDAVERGFAAASVRSPLVQLRDHTWCPYVPCEALSAGRRFDQWYPTDVDSGAMHLPRLKALRARNPLTQFLLDDHEDNLFLHGWGMANEPIYNPQATAYLLRDDAKAAIRTFYSGMACAFSHSVFEPVEHRWTWGQFFGPPSTDGTWFELLRNMLIQERDDGALLLLSATPRRWLEDGKRISVRAAPTCYGLLSMTIESQAAAGRIVATVDVPGRRAPKTLLLRLRHPQRQRIRAVTVDGAAWTDFDPDREWIRIPAPAAKRYTVIAQY